ncbi:MAG TPA: PP0621 family protein [Burkholderiales bacterium]|nr:PP0621 family protein [Burkholderiales bacterium]
MGRLLVLILLIVAAVWLVRRALRRAAPPSGVASAKKTDELVRCAQCGVLLPRAEARMAAGALYCSDEHAKLGPMSGPGNR